MNHQFQYDKIIQNAKSEYRVKHNGVYYENHHILCKCLDGNDEDLNKVLLTSKEHFICHKLLTYIYPHNRKIACAFHYMVYGNSNRYNKSSRDYSYARELINSIPLSDETRNKMGESAKGKHKSEEHKKRIGESNKGKHKEGVSLSEEHIAKLKGFIPWNKGLTKETDKRIKATLGFYNRHHTKESKLKTSNTFKRRRGETIRSSNPTKNTTITTDSTSTDNNITSSINTVETK